MHFFEAVQARLKSPTEEPTWQNTYAAEIEAIRAHAEQLLAEDREPSEA